MSKLKCDVMGLRVLHHIVNDNDNSDRSMEKGVGNRFINSEQVTIILRKPQGLRGEGFLTLTLWNEYGTCGSGWTSATWGRATILPSVNCGPLTHTPKQPMYVSIDPGMDTGNSFDLLAEFLGNDEELCSVSEYGGDEYYPSGGYKVNMSLFEETGRGHKKPLVHVFIGDSNLGKSTIASHLSLKVYETDQNLVLQSHMAECQVIVVGNKYNHTLEEIRTFFKTAALDVEIIPVTFNDAVHAAIPYFNGDTLKSLVRIHDSDEGPVSRTVVAVGPNEETLSAFIKKDEIDLVCDINKLPVFEWRKALIADGIPEDVVMRTPPPARILKYKPRTTRYEVQPVKFIK